MAHGKGLHEPGMSKVEASESLQRSHAAHLTTNHEDDEPTDLPSRAR